MHPLTVYEIAIREHERATLERYRLADIRLLRPSARRRGALSRPARLVRLARLRSVRSRAHGRPAVAWAGSHGRCNTSILRSCSDRGRFRGSS